MYKKLQNKLQLSSLLLKEFIEEYSFSTLNDKQKENLTETLNSMMELLLLAQETVNVSKHITSDELLAKGVTYSELAKRLLQAIFK